MNRVIREYPLRIDGEFQLDLPQTAQIVHVGMNGEDHPALWANVDPSDEGLLRYSFEIVVTDRLFPIGDRYIGTFRFGSLMCHVIETQSAISIKPETSGVLEAEGEAVRGRDFYRSTEDRVGDCMKALETLHINSQSEEEARCYRNAMSVIEREFRDAFPQKARGGE